MSKKVSHVGDMLLAALIAYGPMTAKDLVEQLKLTRRSVDSAIHYAKVRNKRMHISNWRRPEHQGALAPLYSFGPGVDAERPKPLTGKQINKKYRAKNRALINARVRVRRASKAPTWAAVL